MKIRSSDLPRKVTTKGEASNLVADLFPPYAQLDAEHRKHPDPAHAQAAWYYVQDDAADNLRTVMEWLYTPESRVYARARWFFIYDIVQAFTATVQAAREALQDQVRNDLADQDWRRRFAAEAHAETANSTEGAGI